MLKKLKILQYIFTAILLCLVFLAFHRFSVQNQERIQERNKVYAEDASIQTALRIEADFHAAQSLINLYAGFLSEELTEPVVTEAMLKNMEKFTPFDAVRFTNDKGENLSSGGERVDVRDREFFTEGMRGGQGVAAVFNSRVIGQPILGFYAPVYFKGDIIGVLHGAYLTKNYLSDMLGTRYFGFPAEVFLCSLDGRVIASSNAPDYSGNLLDDLLKTGQIDQDDVESARKIFSEGGSGAFWGSGKSELDNLAFTRLKGYNFILAQIFPKSATESVVARANQGGLELELSLLAIFAAWFAFTLLRWRLQKRALEKRNKQNNDLVRAMSLVVASRYCMADLDNGTYTYIAGLNPSFSGDLPVSGTYQALLDQHTSALRTEREREDFYNFFKLDNIKKLLADRELVAFECHVSRDGQEAWENCLACCIERKDGRASKIVFMRQNVTEARLREMDARKQLITIDRKERQYRQAVTSNAFCSFEFNVSKDLITKNASASGKDEKACLFADSDASGKASAVFAAWAEIVQPDSRENFLKMASMDYLQSRFFDSQREVDFDYWITRGDGEELCMRQTFYLSKDEMSGDVMALTVLRDITAQVKAQRAQTKALKEALIQARHANEAKTTFLSNMSHDIRTPMNAIIGFATIAAAHLDNREQVRDCLGKVLSSSNHLLSLINDILDMSRIESGKMHLKEQECNLSEIMHSLVNIIQPQATAKELHMFIDTFGVANEDVVTDPLKLNQIFINLLGNAVKYTPRGGTITFSISQKRAFRHGYADYVFVVRDDGIGMSPEFVKHIFEPFTRESTTQSAIQGTGLGMAITRNIVEMLGGAITVESVQGKGSEFTVTLTLKLLESKKAPAAMDSLRGIRALVVDDDVHVCDSVDKMLKQLGLRSEWTTTGREAVYRAQIAHDDNDPFNTFIIDWQMPGMNGVETARGIRRCVGDDVPIIILTAYDWADIEEEARRAGVTAFCAKPLFMSDLRNALLSSHNLMEEKARESWKSEDFAGRRVLLVDDVELNRELAEMILTESGFVVETAPDGTDAVAMVRASAENYYDIILMDVRMPTMNGYEATRAIRQMDRKDVETMPIIAMTANALEDDKAAAVKAGMNAHVAKPINVKNLLEVLRKFFQA